MPPGRKDFGRSEPDSRIMAPVTAIHLRPAVPSDICISASMSTAPRCRPTWVPNRLCSCAAWLQAEGSPARSTLPSGRSPSIAGGAFRSGSKILTCRHVFHRFVRRFSSRPPPYRSGGGARLKKKQSAAVARAERTYTPRNAASRQLRLGSAELLRSDVPSSRPGSLRP